MKLHFRLLAATALSVFSATALRAQLNYLTPYKFTTLAGSAGNRGYVDGTGTGARFSYPTGVVVDSAGIVYVTDRDNQMVRRITAGGVVTTLAGSTDHTYPSSEDGTGRAARFYSPSGMAIDSAGVIYVGDEINHTIRKISSAGVVTTLAGKVHDSGSNDGVGTAARFYEPTGLAVDVAGNVYVADQYNCTIRKITSAGVVTTLAGKAGSTGSADGTGSAARFYFPQGVAVDSAGFVYVADTANATIRKISSAGVVTTLAGLAGQNGRNDGTGSVARFNQPRSLAVGPGGSIYIADAFNNMIRVVNPDTGQVTSVAGSGSGSVDGMGDVAKFRNPSGLAVDRAGTIYVADEFNHTIRVGVRETNLLPPFVTSGPPPTGTVGQSYSFTFTFSDSPTSYDADGLPSGLTVNRATGVISGIPNEVFPENESAHFYIVGLYATNSTGRGGAIVSLRIERGTKTGQTVAFATLVNKTLGDAPFTLSATGSAGLPVTFSVVSGPATLSGSTLTLTGAGTVVIRASQAGNATINPAVDVDRTFVVSGGASGATAYTFTTLAGSAGANRGGGRDSYGSANGTGSAARFSFPNGVAVDAEGNVFVADTGNGTIRKITGAGVVTTLAGSPSAFGSTDGTGSAARFWLPRGVATDLIGNVYVADTNNGTIRKITAGGTVTTLAGSPIHVIPSSADGTGSAARFFDPAGVAVDSGGRIYIADSGNRTIRKITSAGVVTTLAGTPSLYSDLSADGTGGAAGFYSPSAIAMDSAGNAYVADTGNHTIRKITSSGVVTTFAGTAGRSGSADGTGSAARFNEPSGVAVDSAGNVYVAEPITHTIRKITSAGVVTTLAGTAGSPGSAEGIGSAARFNQPSGVAVDSAGKIYVADSGNNMIRVGMPVTLTIAAPVLSSATVATGTVGQSFTYTAAFSGSPTSYTASGLPSGLALNSTTGVISGTPAVAGNFSIAIGATNSAGTGSATFTLTIAKAPIVAASRLINLSILTSIAAPGDTFTMGYVVGGSGTNGSKPLVIRAAGPSLGALGVSGTLDDPKLELFAGSTKTGENDNWGGSATVANAMAAVGAFAYSGPNSRDATSALSVASGDNSVKVSAVGSGTGAVIAEIYDATPAESFTSSTPRLLNVSVLKPLGEGFTVGFVVGGNTPKNVLVRAIGPTLGTAFGLSGVVSDPQLALFSGQTVIGAYDNWGGGAPLASAFASVGAFVLPPASRDAAVTAALSPGNYTVQVSGVGGATGTILVEIYELP